MRIAIDIDSTLHHHWPLVAARGQAPLRCRAALRGAVPLGRPPLWTTSSCGCASRTRTATRRSPARGRTRTPSRPSTPGATRVTSIHVMSHRAERSVAATRRWLHDVGLRHHDLYCGDDKVAYCRADRHRAPHRRQPADNLLAAPRRRHPRRHAPSSLEPGRVRRGPDSSAPPTGRSSPAPSSRSSSARLRAMPDWPALRPTSVARDVRHAARPHAGARQARGRARAARAAAPARRAAPDRARLGDAAAARARRLGRVRRRARPARARGASSSTATGATQRVPLTPDRPVGEVTRDVLGAVRELGGPGRDRPDAAGGRRGRCRSTRTSEHATLRPRAGRARTSPPRPGPRWCSPRSARRTAAARRRSTPGGARSTSPSASSPGCPAEPPVGRLHHAQRDGRRRRSRSAGGRATRATRAPPSTPTRTPRRDGFARRDARPRRGALGRGARRVRARLGRRARAR